MTISDLVSSVYIKTKTNATSFPAADMLIILNNAYERVASLILKSDGRWEYDDPNQTDLPIATTALVASQVDYSLSTAHLNITGMEVKDQNGVWRKLNPIDKDDLSDLGDSITQDQGVTGVPLYYDLLGGSIFLYPTPSYSQSASLKVYFKRSPALFTSAEVTTGTKSPGFNSLYHDLIPLWVAYDYCLTNMPQLAAGYLNEITRKEDALVRDYGKRNRDDRQLISMMPVNFR